MEKVNALKLFALEKAAGRGVLLQASGRDSIELVRQAAQLLQKEGKLAAVSILEGQKCSALVDAMHLPDGVLVHVDPECLCCLGQERVFYFESSSGSELTSDAGLVESVQKYEGAPQEAPFRLRAAFSSAAFMKQSNLSESDAERMQNFPECRQRLQFCLGKQFGLQSLLRKQSEGARLGIILADPLPLTLETAKELKRKLHDAGVNAKLFYFGPRLDEAKLLNSEDTTHYVLVASCRAALAPWLNAGFRRAGNSVRIATLFEFLVQNEALGFTGLYETDPVACADGLAKWAPDQ